MILAILQARLSSTRLPGKVLRPILGKPMLMLQIERLRRSRKIDRLLVATSSEASDDPLALVCAEFGVDCYRGSLTDVLDRYCKAAEPYAPEHVVRLTGDCPLADPDIIDQVISMHLSNGNDYTSNTLNQSFPDGLDVEVVRYSALVEAGANAKMVSEREHVTPFIYKNPQIFKLGEFRSIQDLSELRWTVDELEDFELVNAIYEALYPLRADFSTEDILHWLQQNPRWKSHNTDFERNAGYKKSLIQDKAV
ncbi:cytidylyltransferase domain-containing protein [Stenotrophobium rhamnosiphilum]|uniref:Spore coat protein n=1 Tax=Stenotrophobium rhamnosiphilum TaxID=2029166 RepID=A0A2T5MIF0_9GAMM|nr:glycosyltransferase family protein [Stenotrophobium rhamnosiphilum]PTU32373.1 spore coat protein [Stenotrophobium rhamnosiphilum]